MNLQHLAKPGAPSSKSFISGPRQAWLVSALASVLIFSAFPSVDLWVSGLFFDGAAFPAATVPRNEAIRHFTWNAGLVTALLSLIGSAIGLFGRRFLWIDGRRWYFSTLLILTGPGLVVNGILKKFWGRARPADITAFGGTELFTPALLPADQCARNCSFVSGEASGAVALAIIIWILTYKIPSNRLRSVLRVAGIVIAVVASYLRIAAGRHFLSDVVFAALIVTGLALLLRPILSTPGSRKIV